jgi:hypothetical protein
MLYPIELRAQIGLGSVGEALRVQKAKSPVELSTELFTDDSVVNCDVSYAAQRQAQGPHPPDWLYNQLANWALAYGSSTFDHG